MDVEGMTNARLGVLYLWQGTRVNWSPASELLESGFSLAGGITDLSGGSMPDIPDTAIGLAGSFADSTGSPASQDNRSTWETIKAWAQDFVKKIANKVREVFGDVEELAGTLKNIAIFIAKKVFAKAAPIIGNAVDLAQGLWKLTVAVCERVSVWLSSRGVQLLKGAPSVIVNGIKTGLNRAILDGLYSTIKPAVGLALNVLSVGASSIVDAITAICETAIRLIWRLFEVHTLNKMIRDAKAHWNNRDHDRGIHGNANRFGDWLEAYTRKVPIVAAVTMGSGIAGDKMRFLNMYAGDGQVISQKQFDKGVRHLDQVKRIGSRYWERSGLDLESDDKMIAALLDLSKRHDEVHAKTKWYKRLFRRADKFVRA